MARSQSVPSRGLGDVGVNPFWSQKTQDEFRLAASRPGDLPNVLDTSDSREPIQSVASGLAVPPFIHGPYWEGTGWHLSWCAEHSPGASYSGDKDSGKNGRRDAW